MFQKLHRVFQKFIRNNIIFDTMEIFQKYFGNIK